jgi:hypothetical protein
MALNTIINKLVEINKDFFTKAGKLHIQRITNYVPENVSEWPWLFFYADDGDVERITFKGQKNAVSNLRTFGQPPPEEVKRSTHRYTHRLQAQLLVRPRKDTKEDEPLARSFIEAFPVLIAENSDLDGLAHDCQVTGYTYGAITLGVFSGKAQTFIGITFDIECIELV